MQKRCYSFCPKVIESQLPISSQPSPCSRVPLAQGTWCGFQAKSDFVRPVRFVRFLALVWKWSKQMMYSTCFEWFCITIWEPHSFAVLMSCWDFHITGTVPVSQAARPETESERERERKKKKKEIRKRKEKERKEIRKRKEKERKGKKGAREGGSVWSSTPYRSYTECARVFLSPVRDQSCSHTATWPSALALMAVASAKAFFVLSKSWWEVSANHLVEKMPKNCVTRAQWSVLKVVVFSCFIALIFPLRASVLRQHLGSKKKSNETRKDTSRIKKEFHSINKGFLHVADTRMGQDNQLLKDPDKPEKKDPDKTHHSAGSDFYGKCWHNNRTSISPGTALD